MQKTSEVVTAFFREVDKTKGANLALDEWVSSLRSDFGDLADIEYRARGLVDRMALAIQATLLLQHAPAYVVDAFCASRLAVAGGHRNYGTLPRGVNCPAIIERATPVA